MGADYEAILAELEAEKERIQTAIDVIRTKMGRGGTASTPSSTQFSGTPFHGLGILDAAKKYLEMVKRTQTTAEIAEALEKGGLKHTSTNFKATVNTILSRDGVRKGGGLKRLASGQWGLAEWYPGSKSKRKADQEGEVEGEQTEEESEPTADEGG